MEESTIVRPDLTWVRLTRHSYSRQNVCLTARTTDGVEKYDDMPTQAVGAGSQPEFQHIRNRPTQLDPRTPSIQLCSISSLSEMIAGVLAYTG
ncbi:hypothetical protein GW17_00060935 [Ensete ventricosum]|nr:hypothetical protein GW17_00060935 [Ensete ventricosum]